MGSTSTLAAEMSVVSLSACAHQIELALNALHAR